MKTILIIITVIIFASCEKEIIYKECECTNDTIVVDTQSVDVPKKEINRNVDLQILVNPGFVNRYEYQSNLTIYVNGGLMYDFTFVNDTIVQIELINDSYYLYAITGNSDYVYALSFSFNEMDHSFKMKPGKEFDFEVYDNKVRYDVNISN